MPKRRKPPLDFFAVLLSSSLPATAQMDARLLRQPDVSETRITFVHGNDIWIVPKEGGTAHKLSSPKGPEQFPRFSPDGETIAFTGNYDGNADVYTIPTLGGAPTRVTHHPETDRVVDWYPDGENLLYATMMTSGRERYSQFYRTSPKGGMPKKLPVAHGEFGGLSSDGRTLAFTEKTRLFSEWKGYRGGKAADIWLFRVSAKSAERVTDHPANDEAPMWAGDTLYFLSDRGPNKRYNIWAHDQESGKKRQVTEFSKVDVHFPAIGPSDLVFEADGELHLLDLETEELGEVNINVVSDRRMVKPRAENVGDQIQHIHISPSGKRAVFKARGNVYTAPAEHGPVRQLTRTSGAAERHPAWSPDGEKIAYFSDASGEYELVVQNADGAGKARALTRLGPGYRYTPHWGPQSERIVFLNEAKQIRKVEVKTGEVTTVGNVKSGWHPLELKASWSPNGRWLAYSRRLANRHHAVFLYDTETGERHQVTSKFYSNSRPVFGPDGKYLFLTTNRRYDPVYSDLDNSFVYPNATQIAVVPLRTGVESPLAPRNDEEPDTEKKQGAEGNQDDGEEGQDSSGNESKPIEIDLKDFERRMVILPPEAGNYSRLAATSKRILFHREPRSGSGDENGVIAYFDLKEREEKTVIEGADTFRLSADGTKLLVAKKDQYDIVDVAPDQKMDKPLKTGEMSTKLDPRAEWKQIFSDVWRFQRDFFYDPNLHGVDWKQMRERYGPLIDDAATRSDVNFIIGELIAELNSSHTYRGGGDTETPNKRSVGLLGIDWSLKNGAYRIERIVQGAPWNVRTRSPLREPGVNVSEGDYILAVNGVPLDTTKDPWAALEGLAGKTVELTVNEQPTMDGARTALLETMKSDDRLRQLEWVDQKRRRVTEASDGRVGYVYVPNTATSGQTELVRQFRAQFDKDALIIDERFNRGGWIPDRLVELLSRQMFAYIALRHGPTLSSPPVAHTGPQAMLINGWSGSGGDAFPWYFARADRGPIIGVRTAGGLIGPAIGHKLIDGGWVVAPPGRFYGPDGDWFNEGHGVEPDIRVENDPESLARGKDPQLERAIDEMQEALEGYKAPQPERPPYEDRTLAGQSGGGDAAATETTLSEYASELLGKRVPAGQPGMAALVSRGGERLYHGAQGMADISLGVELEADHVFKLASVTKQFTATAVLRLAQEGKLSLNDPITRFLPDYPMGEKPVTVHQLLNHTSGIRSFTSIPGYMQNEVRDDVSVEALIERFQNEPVDFPPGKHYEYNNSGYILLGVIIEKVSGKSYSQYLEETFFEPLSMTNTAYGLQDRIIPGLVEGYKRHPEEGLMPARLLSMTQTYSAGGLVSNTVDLSRWLQALHNGRVLDQSWYEKMITPRTPDPESSPYGYGVSIGKVRGDRAIEHGGRIFGFSSYSLYLPEHKLSVAVLANVAMNTGAIAKQLAAKAIGNPYPKREAVSLSTHLLESYQGVYRISEEETRKFIVEDGKAYTQNSNGQKRLVHAASPTKFFYPDSLSYFTLERDGDGEVVAMQMYHGGEGPAQIATRAEEKLEPRSESE